jgi:hypothetical protein
MAMIQMNAGMVSEKSEKSSSLIGLIIYKPTNINAGAVAAPGMAKKTGKKAKEPPTIDLKTQVEQITFINNKGYNKYLKLEGEINITIDLEKFNKDQAWDGIKGYLTNTHLNSEEVIANYRNLWYIERAFRMSKTDLRGRPIYHRLINRIEAHICICFTAYTIMLEMERRLKAGDSKISIKRAGELAMNMYQLVFQLPKSKTIKTQLLKMDIEQFEVLKIIRS